MRDFNPGAAWSSDLFLTLCFLCNATMARVYSQLGRAPGGGGLPQCHVIIRVQIGYFPLWCNGRIQEPQRTPIPMRRPLFPCNATVALVYSQLGRAMGAGGCGEVPRGCLVAWPQPSPQPDPGRCLLATNVLVMVLAMARTCAIARPPMRTPIPWRQATWSVTF